MSGGPGRTLIMRSSVWSLDGLGEPPNAQDDEDNSETHTGKAPSPELPRPRPPQQDTPQYPQIVRERQERTQPLRRRRHRLPRKHEAGQQDVGKEEEEAELHGLSLRLHRRRDQKPERQIGDDEREC